MVPWSPGALCGFTCEVHEEADEGRERSISAMGIRGINLAFRDTDQSIKVLDFRPPDRAAINRRGQSVPLTGHRLDRSGASTQIGDYAGIRMEWVNPQTVVEVGRRAAASIMIPAVYPGHPKTPNQLLRYEGNTLLARPFLHAGMTRRKLAA